MRLLETKYERKSAAITSVITAIIFLLLFFFGFTYLDPPPENGIAINFGTSEIGSGQVQPTEPVASSPQQQTPEPTPSPQENSSPVADEVQTQDTEEAPVIAKEKENKQPVEKEQKDKKEQPKQEVPEKEKPQEPVKEEPKKPSKETSDALNNLLNGPENDGANQGGEGNDSSGGDKGDPSGDPNAKSYYGQGKGLDGDGNYRLGGRKALNKEKFVQECNESGVVVVKIEVNQQGQVIRATPGARGTTNTAPCLMEPAKRAALATRFNSDANAPAKQTGFIEYEFKLSE
ncbi:energy transducer TonB [Mesonia sediminis]|uniref:Energy transducer TonB n=1 Tax=Mesonia sediminis TaxID=1703946 RepID=A0ABW5S9W7_9FLAO|nr:energy transducer TonB [Mesonia sp. HuA40]TXK74033.1 energy transducer TonB [Mesonia sp. HuA40]